MFVKRQKALLLRSAQPSWIVRFIIHTTGKAMGIKSVQGHHCYI